MLKTIIKKVLGEANIQYLRESLKSKPDKYLVEKRKMFYGKFAKNGALYFDVGANFGNRIEVMLDLGCRVVAIEPQKECCKYLKKKYGSRITLVEKGLGEKEEIKEFFISDSHTISSFSKDFIRAVQESKRFGSAQWKEGSVVDMTTLDKLISSFGQPQFIKIDVEGYELEVLKGLSTVVPYISFEYTAPEQIDKSIACIKHLQKIDLKSKMRYNFSIGESMEWGLAKWLSADAMIAYIQTQNFIDTNFGDIYARFE